MIISSKHGKKSTKVIASTHKLSANCERLLGEHDLQRGNGKSANKRSVKGLLPKETELPVPTFNYGPDINKNINKKEKI